MGGEERFLVLVLEFPPLDGEPGQGRTGGDGEIFGDDILHHGERVFLPSERLRKESHESIKNKREEAIFTGYIL